ncbi:unnamed protein product [Trichobilharzia regenti]|nr:unnamed protein product [Trichobilharzia regenti]
MIDCKGDKSTIVHVWKDTNWQTVMKNATQAGYRVLFSAAWYLNLISYGDDWKNYYLINPRNFGDKYSFSSQTGRLINKLTRLSQTEARYENRLIFNIRCLKNEIILKYLHLRATAPTKRVRSRIESLQKLCLKEEIHRIVKKLQHFRCEIEQLKQKLKGIDTNVDYDLMTQPSNNAKSATFKKSKNSQINKLLEEKSRSQNDEVNNPKSTAIDKSK